MSLSPKQSSFFLEYFPPLCPALKTHVTRPVPAISSYPSLVTQPGPDSLVHFLCLLNTVLALMPKATLLTPQVALHTPPIISTPFQKLSYLISQCPLAVFWPKPLPTPGPVCPCLTVPGPLGQLLPLPGVLSATPAALDGPFLPQPPLQDHPTSHPALSIPPHALPRSHCPLDLIPGLPGPLCPLSLPSGLLGPRCPLGPTSGAVSLPLYPRSAHLRPWLSPQPLLGRPITHPALSMPSGPVRPLHPLRQAISLPGRHPRLSLPPRFRSAGWTLTTP